MRAGAAEAAYGKDVGGWAGVAAWGPVGRRWVGGLSRLQDQLIQGFAHWIRGVQRSCCTRRGAAPCLFQSQPALRTITPTPPTPSLPHPQDRTDRELVTPWFRFLWESYRSVLEILRTNPKLEPLYAMTATKAFHFCLQYKRTTEFKRLCDILRQHLTNLVKWVGTWRGRGKRGWESALRAPGRKGPELK